MKPKVDVKSFISGMGLRDMLDKNKLSKYLWYICKLSYICFNFITKKTNSANILSLIKTGISSIPMHLNDNEIDKIQEFLPKYKILEEFPKEFHICI